MRTHHNGIGVYLIGKGGRRCSIKKINIVSNKNILRSPCYDCRSASVVFHDVISVVMRVTIFRPTHRHPKDSITKYA